LVCDVWSGRTDRTWTPYGASILERVSDDRGDVIPPRHDQETDQPLVSVDDEVATHLFGLFMVRDELRRRQVAEVTPSGL
jgi:hypothetical protein